MPSKDNTNMANKDNTNMDSKTNTSVDGKENSNMNVKEDSSNNNESAAESQTKEVSSEQEPEFCDPVVFMFDNQQITVKKGDEITQNNKIISSVNTGEDSKNYKFKGYFGLPRWRNEKISQHTGYDYIAEVGVTDVKAVHDGKIKKIRFGKKTGECKIKEKFIETGDLKFVREQKENNEIKYHNDFCNKTCSRRCLGLQVWIELDNVEFEKEKLCAYYAHLSALDSQLFAEISKGNEKDRSERFDKENTICIEGIHVKKGQNIGTSGDTGNAFDQSPKHLHFECRKGEAKRAEQNTQISPNKIVQTELNIKKKGQNDLMEIKDEIEKGDFVEYLTNKSIEKEINNKIEEKIRVDAEKNVEINIIKPEWDNSEKEIRREKFWGEGQKYTFKEWYEFSLRWYDERESRKKEGRKIPKTEIDTERKKFWNELYNPLEYDDNEWILFTKKNKQWEGKGEKGKLNESEKEFKNFKKEKFNTEDIKKAVEDKINEIKKNEELSQQHRLKSIEEVWNKIETDKDALYKYKDNHVLVIGKIKGEKDTLTNYS